MFHIMKEKLCYVADVKNTMTICEIMGQGGPVRQIILKIISILYQVFQTLKKLYLRLIGCSFWGIWVESDEKCTRQNGLLQIFV